MPKNQHDSSPTSRSTIRARVFLWNPQAGAYASSDVRGLNSGLSCAPAVFFFLTGARDSTSFTVAENAESDDGSAALISISFPRQTIYASKEYSSASGSRRSLCVRDATP